MPIRDKSLYPTNWQSIRAHILERDKHRCKWCGAANYQPHPETGARVVLTIMHWPDHNPANCADDNLAAACQACHNRMDAPMRSAHAAETRRRKRDAISGQMSFIAT